MKYEVITQFNYGKTSYVLPIEIVNVKKSDNAYRAFKKHIAPVHISINEYAQLAKMLKQYIELFPKFIDIVYTNIQSKNFSMKETSDLAKKFPHIFEEDNQVIRGFAYEIKNINVKSSFLSYVLQNKEELYNKFNSYLTIKRPVFTIVDSSKYFNTLRRKRVLITGTHKAILVDMNKRPYEKIIRINHDGRVLVDDIYYTTTDLRQFSNNRVLKLEDIKLYTVERHLNNEYDAFVELLQSFFADINPHNDENWDGYITEESKKLFKYLAPDELEKIQKEYAEENKKRKQWMLK